MTRRADDKLEADLSAYLDGELGDERAREVEQQLAGSPEARRLLDELRDVTDRLAALPRRAAPDELTAAMARHAERRLLFGEQRAPRRPRVLRLFAQLSASAAVLAACVYIGWQALRPADQPAPAAPDDAVVVRSLEKSGKGADVVGDEPGEERLAAAGGSRGRSPDVSSSAPMSVVVESAARPTEEKGGRGVSLGQAWVTTDTPETDESQLGKMIAGRPVVRGGLRSERGSPPIETMDETSVDVYVMPENDAQYTAAVALLNEWGAFGTTSAELYHAGAAEQRDAASAVEVVYSVAPDEIQRYIALLESRAPRRVHVQMSFPASRDDLFVQSEAEVEPRVLAFTRAEPMSAEDEEGAGSRNVFRGGGAGAGAAERPQQLDADSKEETETRAAETSRAGGGRGARAAPARRRGQPTHHRAFLDPDAQRQRREDLSERHKSATDEPTIVVLPPPPAEDAGRTPPTSQPQTERSAPTAPKTAVGMWLRRLLRGSQKPESSPTSRPAESVEGFAAVPASQPTADDTVVFRVQVFRPSASAQPPESQPHAPPPGTP